MGWGRGEREERKKRGKRGRDFSIASSFYR